jgi:hypothetical protein
MLAIAKKMIDQSSTGERFGFLNYFGGGTILYRGLGDPESAERHLI